MVTSANPIAAFARSRNVQVLIACVAIAIVLSETAVRSLSREGERPPPSAAIDRVPAPAVKTASLRFSSVVTRQDCDEPAADGEFVQELRILVF